MDQIPGVACGKNTLPVAEPTYEIAPLYWVPVKIDYQDPTLFWDKLPYQAPEPLEGIDLREYTPWWKDFKDKVNGVLNEKMQPFSKLDPSLFNTTDEQFHARLRKVVSNAYAMSTLVTFEPLVDTTTIAFLEQLKRRFAGRLGNQGIVQLLEEMFSIFSITFY